LIGDADREARLRAAGTRLDGSIVAPTPLQLLEGLPGPWSGRTVWVKRDDRCGPGGTKARKLAVALGDARRLGANGLLTFGTLDSNRTQVVMQNLLEAIVAKESNIAIIDITGVPTVDTLVAQHLLKTVAAARLMGAECIISGIRPQIAQTIIHLGVDLGNVITKATLADAFLIALRKLGRTVTKS